MAGSSSAAPGAGEPTEVRLIFSDRHVTASLRVGSLPGMKGLSSEPLVGDLYPVAQAAADVVRRPFRCFLSEA